MKAFARFIHIQIWCEKLAYVDKVDKDKSGVKYLLVSQDALDRTVDAKRIRKRFPRNGSCIFDRDHKKITQKIGVEKEAEIAGEVKNFAKLKEDNFTLQ